MVHQHVIGRVMQTGLRVACIAVLLVASATLCHAQHLSIDAMNDELDFGTLYPGAVASLTPTSPGALCYKVSGPRGATVAIQIATAVTLRRSGPGTIPFSRSAVKKKTTYTQSGLLPLLSATQSYGTFTLPSGGSACTASMYIWFAGSITTSAATSAGSYTGVLLISISQMCH
ncbi:MAG: hypothetical protein HY962_05410 [Ignavibacteriae bacterium]|nr:hypothetical protein [Ignavibacteriota bacterium]